MMSVDLDNQNTWLVADSSVLISSLATVRAVIESNQPYSLYVPYVVLTELDRGSTAATVNQLLCRYMKQKNPRIMAQGVDGHKNVSLAEGIAPKNDDLILGSALKLKQDGLAAIMLTNDNNLSVKCCANGLTTWSSLDLLCKVREAIARMDHFIVKDIRLLCSRPDQCLTFCTELLMCALKFHLGKQDETSSISSGLVYRLIDKAQEKKLADKSLLTNCSQLIKEFRKKSRRLSLDDVLRFLRYVCALLELWKEDKVITRILNVFKGIFSGLKLTRKTKPTDRKPAVAINANKSKISLEDLSSEQQKCLVQTIGKLDASRSRKVYGIKKSTTRRKSLPKNKLSDVCDSTDPNAEDDVVEAQADDNDGHDDEMETDDNCARDQMINPVNCNASVTSVPVGHGLASKISVSPRKRNNLSKATMLAASSSSSSSNSTNSRNINSSNSRNINGNSSSGNSSVSVSVSVSGTSSLPDVSQKSKSCTEIDSFLKRPRQAFGPIEGIDVNLHPVYRALKIVWEHLHELSGTCASHYGVEYAWKPNLQHDLDVNLKTLKQLSDLLSEIDADYSRLLKLGIGVAVDLLLITAARFIDRLRKVYGKMSNVTPEQVIQFFQDDRTSHMLWNGRTQLQTFHQTIVKCRNLEIERTLQRVDKSQ